MIRPVARVEALTKRFPVRAGPFRAAASLTAVDGIDFAIMPGETLSLVGESGCGKSTTGRLVVGLTAPTSGRIEVDGEPVDLSSARRRRALARRAQIVFQDPFGSLNPRMTAGALIAEPILLHRLAARVDAARRVAELLSTVGLSPSHAARFPHEFSGGQRQRIGIARALAVEPKLIVCDEAVSALDVSVRAQIVNLLGGLQRRLGLSYLFISHDLSVVRHVSHRVAVMYLGRIVEIGAAADIFGRPRHPYTLALISAAPAPRPGGRGGRIVLEGDVPSPLDPPGGCTFHPRCPYAIERCRSERPELAPADGRQSVACHRWAEISAPAAAAGLPPMAPRAARILDLYREAAARRASPTVP